MKGIFDWLRGLFNKRDTAQAQYQPTPTATPTPTPVPGIPAGTDIAMDYLRSIQPNGQSFEQAYPVATNSAFMKGVGDADQLRPGLSNLLLLQALFESTMGRNSGNIFGVKPGGRSGAGFETPEAALEYQLGPSVMGGGANPNMNLLEEGEKGKPITQEELNSFYSSYNPESYYLKNLMNILFPGR